MLRNEPDLRLEEDTPPRGSSQWRSGEGRVLRQPALRASAAFVFAISEGSLIHFSKGTHTLIPGPLSDYKKFCTRFTHQAPPHSWVTLAPPPGHRDLG